MSKNNEKFMRESLKLILADPDHPLRFHVNEQSGTWKSRSSSLQEHHPSVQAGHRVDEHALKSGWASALGLDATERLALEEGYDNWLDSSGARRGAIHIKSTILIGNVHVDLDSAKSWAKHITDQRWQQFVSSLPGGSLDYAPQSTGWTAPTSPLAPPHARPVTAWGATATVATTEETKETFYKAVQLPGGIIINPRAAASLGVQELELSITEPGVLLVNRQRFESGLSYEEVYRLARVAQTSHTLRATSTLHVEGTNSADVVGATLRSADAELGDLVFGEWRSEPPLTFEALDALSEAELVARLERKFTHTSAVVSLEFDTPSFSTAGSALLCSNAPFKVHFIPFEGGTGSPRFSVDPARVPLLFPSETRTVRHIAANPAILFSRSVSCPRVQRYAVLFALFRCAKINRISIANSSHYQDIFEAKRTVVRDVQQRNTATTLHPVDLEAVSLRLRRAADSSSFLMAVGSSFLYVLSRDPSALPSVEARVREQMRDRLPPYASEEEEKRESRYLRFFACSMALGVPSLNSGALKPRSTFEASFEGAVHELSVLLRDQKLSGYSDILWRMPLRPTGARGAKTSSWKFMHCVERLCLLGYADSVRRILISRLSREALANPHDLFGVDTGVQASVSRCFEHLAATDAAAGWSRPTKSELENVDHMLQRMITSFLRQVSLESIAVGSTTVPTAAVAEHEFTSLLSSGLLATAGVSVADIQLVRLFLQMAREAYKATDWETVVNPIARTVSATTTGSPLSGEVRLRAEADILEAFGKLDGSEVNTLIDKYKTLVNDCVAHLRNVTGRKQDPLSIIALSSKYLFREARVKFKNVDTLVEAVKGKAFDCDAICHVYADILLTFGIESRFVLSDGHAHLAVGDFHFEARGGLFLSTAAAVDGYGLTWEATGNEVASAIGASSALYSVFDFLNANDFAIYLKVKSMLEKLLKTPGIIVGGRDMASTVSLNARQIQAVSKCLKKNLSVMNWHPLVTQTAYVVIEILARQPEIQQQSLSDLRQSFGIEDPSKHSPAKQPEAAPPQDLQSIEKLGMDMHDFLWGKSGDLAELGYSYASTKQEALDLLRSGVELQWLQGERDPVGFFNREFYIYTYKLKLADKAPDRGFAHCIYAWGTLNTNAQVEAGLQLLGRHLRPDLARLWTDSVISRPSRAHNHIAVCDGARVFSFFGDVEKIDAYYAQLTPMGLLHARQCVDEERAKAVNPDIRFKRNMDVFITGGYKSVGGTEAFLEQMQKMGRLAARGVQDAQADLKRIGPCIATACNVLQRINPNSLVELKTRLLFERDFDGLRSFIEATSKAANESIVPYALAAREQGRHQVVLDAKDQLLQHAKGPYYWPVKVALAEAMAFSGDTKDIIKLLELMARNEENAPIFIEYTLEIVASLALISKRAEDAETALVKLSEMSDHRYQLVSDSCYQHALHRKLIELRHPALANPTPLQPSSTDQRRPPVPTSKANAIPPPLAPSQLSEPIKAKCLNCGGILHSPSDAVGKSDRFQTCSNILPITAPNTITKSSPGPSAQWPKRQSVGDLIGPQSIALLVRLWLRMLSWISLSVKTIRPSNPLPVQPSPDQSQSFEPIKFTCSSCGGVVCAPADAGGKRGRCPTCGTILPIPYRS